VSRQSAAKTSQATARCPRAAPRAPRQDRVEWPPRRGQPRDRDCRPRHSIHSTLALCQPRLTCARSCQPRLTGWIRRSVRTSPRRFGQTGPIAHPLHCRTSSSGSFTRLATINTRSATASSKTSTRSPPSPSSPAYILDRRSTSTSHSKRGYGVVLPHPSRRRCPAGFGIVRFAIDVDGVYRLHIDTTVDRRATKTGGAVFGNRPRRHLAPLRERRRNSTKRSTNAMTAVTALSAAPKSSPCDSHRGGSRRRRTARRRHQR
jgi:hypothetical protein